MSRTSTSHVTHINESCQTHLESWYIFLYFFLWIYMYISMSTCFCVYMYMSVCFCVDVCWYGCVRVLGTLSSNWSWWISHVTHMSHFTQMRHVTQMSRVTHMSHVTHMSEWVMSHTSNWSWWISHVTHIVLFVGVGMDESCHTHEEMSHVIHIFLFVMNESCHTYEGMSHVTQIVLSVMNESCHTHERWWWMSHVTFMSQSCLLHDESCLCCSVLQCVAVCFSVLFMKESCHIHEWVMSSAWWVMSMLQCGAVCCIVLRCVAVCCIVLQCVAVCCIVLQCVGDEGVMSRSWMSHIFCMMSHVRSWSMSHVAHMNESCHTRGVVRGRRLWMDHVAHIMCVCERER